MLFSQSSRSARASTINPTFAVGGVTSVTPVARSARASRINPSMIFGSVSITPAARGAVAKAINPTALGVGASWLAALNTPITVDIVTGTDFLRDELGLVTDAEGNLITVQAPGGPNARVRLRVGIHNTSAILGASGFKWQFRVNAGTWTDLTSSSAHVRTFDSAYFADGDDVPQSITAGSYQANNNAAEESTGEFTLAAGLAGGFYFETELALEIIGADVSLTNDTLDFRIVLASGALLNTYSQVPQLLARLVSVTLVRPAAVSAKTGRVGPTAVFGSLSLSPAARTARVSRINPTVTAGNPVAVTPAARTSRASRTNPTFVYGALSLHPAARTARGQSTAPTVIRGSILLTAIVSAKTRTTNPAIQFSSMAVSPQAIAAIAGKTNPFVAIANVIVQPQAVASRARSSNPSIILGNVSTAPATATARTSTTDPIVFLASTLVTPLAVRTRASSIAPAVQIIGSTSITAVVTTKTSLVNPTFSYGSLSIASVAARALTSRISPSVLYGSTTITAVASARTGLIDPAIRLGDATIGCCSGRRGDFHQVAGGGHRQCHGRAGSGSRRQLANRSHDSFRQHQRRTVGTEAPRPTRPIRSSIRAHYSFSAVSPGQR